MEERQSAKQIITLEKQRVKRSVGETIATGGKESGGRRGGWERGVWRGGRVRGVCNYDHNE